MLTFQHTSPRPHTNLTQNAFPEPNDIQNRFGRRLRSLRKERGWTQVQMAVDLGLDRGHICEIERGRKTVSLRTLHIFAMGLKMELSELLRGV